MQFSEARKSAALKVKLSSEKRGKKFGERQEDHLKMANKVLGQTVRRWRGKRSQYAFFIEYSNGLIVKDEDAILSSSIIDSLLIYSASGQVLPRLLNQNG